MANAVVEKIQELDVIDKDLECDLPSDPILLILVSSDHNTPFQSPNIQFSWYLQKIKVL